MSLSGLEPEVGLQYPTELSGGMLKRASMARALALDPELLFLDEPTAGLDPGGAGGIDALVRSLHALYRLTMVIITHDLDFLWQVTDRVAVLGEGKVVGLGSMAELAAMDHPIIRAYFDGPRGRAAQEQAEPRLRVKSPSGTIVDTKVNYAVVGVFVLALAQYSLSAYYGWRSVPTAKRTMLYMSIINESVAGLSVDAPVKYLGVDVGKVEKILLDPDNPQVVQLLFAIRKTTPIREDTEAVLKTQGLTGIAYVELSGGNPQSRPLTAIGPGGYPMIRTIPSLSARLENVLTSVLAKLDRTSANIDALFDDENRAEIKRSLSILLS